MSSERMGSKVSARCLQLLALAALHDRRQLVAIAYALKNDARLSAVKLAQRWCALTPEELRIVAERILGGRGTKGE